MYCSRSCPAVLPVEMLPRWGWLCRAWCACPGEDATEGNAERVSQRQRNEIRHFGLVPVRAKAFEFSHVRSWAMLVTLLARALASATHNLDQREAVHLVRRHTSTWWCTGTDHKASAQPRARVVLYIITTKPKYLDETSQTAAFLASRVGHG